jgi:hypothetical protein
MGLALITAGWVVKIIPGYLEALYLIFTFLAIRAQTEMR